MLTRSGEGRGRHFVQRSQGCGEDGREEGTATETAGGILSTSRCSRFCAGRQHPVRKLRECEEMTPALFFSQKEGHSSLSHRHVTFRPEKGPHFYGRAWGLSGTLWVLEGTLKSEACLCPGARERKTFKAPSVLQRWAELQASRLSL